MNSSCDVLLEYSNSGNGMRGTKRHNDDSRDDDVKPSKEPMLSADHLMMTDTSSGGGGGVLHQLLGPPAPPNSMPAVVNPLVPHHSTTAPLSVASLQQQQSLPHHSLPSPVAAIVAVPVPGLATSTASSATLSTGLTTNAAIVGGASGPPGSKLCEKNKMLASLLAKKPMQSLPASVASPKPSALPQEKLPKDLKVGCLLIQKRVRERKSTTKLVARKKL